MNLIEKIAGQHLQRLKTNLVEDYSTNPIAPNDTSYVGFFFEKDVTQLPVKLREKYESIKKEIDLKEAEYREKFGDDWRNIVVFNAYRGIKEEAEVYESDDGIHLGVKVAVKGNKGKEPLKVVKIVSDDTVMVQDEHGQKQKVLIQDLVVVESTSYEKDMDDSKPVIVRGVKGMKSTPFTKKFKNMAAYEKWTDSDEFGNFEVYSIQNESVNEEEINETGMSKDLALQYAKISSSKGHNDIEIFKHPELGFYVNSELNSQGRDHLVKRGAKHYATASGGKLSFKMNEDHFSEKELSNMYSKFDKENNHDGLEAIEDYISAEADGNKPKAAKAAGKLKKLMKEDVSSEGAAFFKKLGFEEHSNWNPDDALAVKGDATSVVLANLKKDGWRKVRNNWFVSSKHSFAVNVEYQTRGAGRGYTTGMWMDKSMHEESVNEGTGEVVKMTMPLFIRLMEWAYEDCKNDVEIHQVAETLSEISSVADMDDYDKLVREELDEALKGNWTVEKIQKLKPAQIKVLQKNASDAYDKAVLDMIAQATAPKTKTASVKMQPAKPKPDLDKIWYKIQDVVGQIVPDGDPIDYMAPWLESQGIRGFDISDVLDKAAKKHGYKDMYAYYNEVAKQYHQMKNEAYGDRKYGLKKTDADRAAKVEALAKIKDKIVALRADLATAEARGNDAEADEIEKKIKRAQADYSVMQAHG